MRPNQSLESLDVSNNTITNDGAAMFVRILNANTSIESIVLAGNVLANFVPAGEGAAQAVITSDKLIKAHMQ